MQFSNQNFVEAGGLVIYELSQGMTSGRLENPEIPALKLVSLINSLHVNDFRRLSGWPLIYLFFNKFLNTIVDEYLT